MPNAKDVKKVAAPRFFVLGDIGSGKTTQFLTLPGKKFAYLFDSNGLLSLRGHDVDFQEFLPGEQNLNVKSLSEKRGGDNVTNIKNIVYTEWQKDFTDKLSSGFFDSYEAILFDSATTLLDLIMDRILTVNGRAGQWPHQDDYGPQMVTFSNICRTLISLGKVIYMTGHTQLKQDDLTKKIYRQPMLTGQLKAKIPLLFSDIFVASTDVDQNGQVKYLLQTIPDRVTTTIRTSFKGLNPFEDVTLDWGRKLEDQGLGRLLAKERQ